MTGCDMTWLFVLMTVACAGAEDTDPPSDGGAAAEASVCVQTVDAEPIRGQLIAVSMADGAVVRTVEGKQLRIPMPDVVRITTSVATRTPRGVWLSLAGGDSLCGRVESSGKESVTIATADLERVSVPLDMVARMETARAISPAYREAVAWFDRGSGTTEDRALLTNGDVVAGFVTAIDSEGITVEREAGEAFVPHRLLVVLTLGSPPPVRSTGIRMAVTFRSSGRLTVPVLDWSADKVTVRLPSGADGQIEAERIVSIDVIGGRWEWLGQHAPVEQKHTPMLSMNWPALIDRNVTGGPITVAGEVFEHGIGVHSESRLAYDLKGAYGEFVTAFGMDDDSGPLADVSVSVFVDGKVVFEQPSIRRGALHGPHRWSVAGAQRLELVVGFGKNGDLQDRFDWVNAALVK